MSIYAMAATCSVPHISHHGQLSSPVWWHIQKCKKEAASFYNFFKTLFSCCYGEISTVPGRTNQTQDI